MTEPSPPTPFFALAHAGKAQVLMRQGDVAAARVALRAAKDAAIGMSEREASHIGFFDLVFAGRTDAAIAALYSTTRSTPGYRFDLRIISRRATRPTANVASEPVVRTGLSAGGKGSNS